MNSDVNVSISVVIVARNEEKNIAACLHSIINQTYPENLFEIILVNDHSSDGTVSIAESFKKKTIRIINLKDFTGITRLNSYKKIAIAQAISIAKGNLIVTTDADCIVPTLWLETLAGFYEQNDFVFIAAPVVYLDPLPDEPLFKRLLKNFQTLDFLTLQGITGASVHKRFHNMCNGANLAYTKEVFIEVSGFEGIDDIASGDDMLLMQKIQKFHPLGIGFLKSGNAVVETLPADTIKGFLNQRIRWASKTGKYSDPKITGVLVLVYLFNVSIFIAAFCAFFSLPSFYLFIILLLVKTLAELFFLLPVARFFGKQNLLWWFAPAQPFHILYTIIAGWLGKFGSYKWKGRKVK
ncbi:MAG: glycosyltransferase [Ginsengibacter sp.]